MSISESDQHHYYDKRALPRDPKDKTAPELFLTTENQSDEYLNMCYLYQDHLDSLISESLSPNQNYVDIATYTKHRELHKPEAWNVSNLLPRKQTLETALRVDQANTKTWTQPCLNSTRRLSTFTLAHFSVNKFDKFVFQSQLLVFDSVQQDAKNMILNSTPIPFSVQTIRVPSQVYRDIVKNNSPGRVVEFDYDPSITDFLEVPTKLIVGCGRNGAMVISFGFSEVGYHGNDTELRKYVFKYSTIPDEILKFMKNLPPLFSTDAKKQRAALCGLLTDLYNVDLSLRVFDLGALAIVAGCRMNDFSLFSFSAIIKNEPFPTGLEPMDQKWARNWSDVPKIMGQYIRDKFQLMYDAYTTLMGLLLRNLFPDPDITLSVTEVSQLSFICWFSHFIALALSEANLRESTHQLPTRCDMILRLGPDTGLLGILADLVINIPVANFGGARYLHNARYHFLTKQYYAMCRVKMYKFSGEIPNLSKDLDNETYGFMYNREYVNDSGRPAYKVGLLSSPQYERSLLILEPDMDDVVCLDGYTGRNIAADIKEWGRLNVDMIPELFNQLRDLTVDDLSKFWIDKISVYSSLSDIYFNIKNIRLVVPDLERSLKMRKERTEENYKQREYKLLLKSQERRVNIVHHATVSQSNNQRVAVHQYVQDIIPGDFNAKNRRKARQKKLRVKRIQARLQDSFISAKDRKRDRLANELRSFSDQLPGSSRRYRFKEDRFKSRDNGDLRLQIQSKDLRRRL